MTITHNRTRIPDAVWADWIRFLKPSGTNLDYWRFQFQQGSGDWVTGRAWRDSKRVHLRVTCAYPGRGLRVSRGRRGYLPHTTYTSEERIVLVLAHELRHVWQYQNPNGRRVWGSRGLASERDADAYAIGALRRFRRERGMDLRRLGEAV